VSTRSHALLVALGVGMLPVPPAQSAQEILLFPAVTALRQTDANASANEDRELEPVLDLFYSLDGERWRLLTEVFLSEDEQEIERLQLGWRTRPGDTLWFGKFHTPASYWASQYHHGAYVQPSVTRPGIHEFEDDGGPLTTHLAGLLYDGASRRSAGELRYALALGAGFDAQLEPVDVLSPGEGHHGLNAAARVGFAPGELGTTEFGVYAAYGRTPGDGVAFDENTQTLAGAYATTTRGSLHVTAELLFIHDHFALAGSVAHGSFVNGYAEVDYNPHEKWLLFTRLEDSRGEDDDPYLAHFPAFVQRQAIAGARYDVTRRQALKLELGRATRRDDRLDRVFVQWSAVFP
jgi:hypothetical protein